MTEAGEHRKVNAFIFSCHVGRTCMRTSNSADEQEDVVGVAMRFIKEPRLKLIREESSHSCLCF